MRMSTQILVGFLITPIIFQWLTFVNRKQISAMLNGILTYFEGFERKHVQDRFAKQSLLTDIPGLFLISLVSSTYNCCFMSLIVGVIIPEYDLFLSSMFQKKTALVISFSRATHAYFVECMCTR
ncbi:unnamed protein product, partial [Allacma fusca]